MLATFHGESIAAEDVSAAAPGTVSPAEPRALSWPFPGSPVASAISCSSDKVLTISPAFPSVTPKCSGYTAVSVTIWSAQTDMPGSFKDSARLFHASSFAFILPASGTSSVKSSFLSQIVSHCTITTSASRQIVADKLEASREFPTQMPYVPDSRIHAALSS